MLPRHALSIGTVVLGGVLVELVRSALPPPGSDRPRPFTGWSSSTVTAERQATTRAALLTDAGCDVLVWHPAFPEAAPTPERQDVDAAAPVPRAVGLTPPGRIHRPLARHRRRIADRWAGRGGANGVLGDPTGATGEEGRRIFGMLVGQLCAAVDRWQDTLER